MTPQEIVELGRRVIAMEQAALGLTAGRVGPEFARAVEIIATAKGRTIVAGVGKSGLIGRKIAATLTSTGTPATFLHPTESAHGDLGIVGASDVAILISKSGETEELLPLLEQLKRLGVRVIAITGQARSIPRSHARLMSRSTLRWMKKHVPTTWRQRRAPRCNWRWVTPWRCRCSK